MADKNPYDISLDSGGGGGSKKKKDPVQEVTDAQYGFTPEETEAVSLHYSEVYGRIPEQWVYDAPDFIQKIAYGKDDAERAAAMQAYEHWTTIFGAELAPTLQASLMSDKEQGDFNLALIQEIASRDLSPIMSGRAVVNTYGGNATVDPDKLSRVIADPTLLDRMPPEEKNAYIKQARLIKERLPVESNLGQQLWAITGQTLSRNYSVFMDENELRHLDLVLAYSKGGEEGLRAAAKGSSADARETFDTLGIADIEQPGSASTIVTFDEKWARARPVRAAATMDFLRTQLPGVQFRVGEKGIVGSVLDKWGKAIDYVSAPIGAAYGALGEVVGEFEEKFHSDLTDEDRQRAKDLAAKLRDDVAKGRVPPEEVQNYLNAAVGLEDNAESEVNYDWGEAIDNSINPKQAGFGFAENYTQALDLLPGDPGYDIAYATSGLVANIVLDPANYVFPAISGVRAGVKGVAGMAELPGKIEVGLKAFKTMGQATTRKIAGVVRRTGTLEEVVGKGRWAIIPVADEGVLKAAKADNLSAAKITLADGSEGYLIPGMNPEHAMLYGREFGAHEVITTEGLIEVGTRRVRPVEKITRNAEEADQFVTFGDQAWGWKFSPKSVKARPENIGQSFTKNWFYRHTVKTPEQWAATKPARDAVTWLWRRRQGITPEQFMAKVQRLFNTDTHTARMLAYARSEEDMMNAILAGMTGNASAPFNAGRSLARRDELKAILDEWDEIDSKIAELEKVDESQMITAEDLDELYRDTTQGEGAAGMFAEPLPNEDRFFGMNRKPIESPIQAALKNAEPGPISNLLKGLSPEDQARLRNMIVARRAKKANIINAPEKLQRGRGFASGGRFYTKMPVRMLRDPSIVDETGFVGIRRRLGTPRDDEYLSGLKKSISDEGIKDPLMLEVGPNGKLIVLDGTHRAMLAEELDMIEVPVVFNTAGLETADRTYRWLDEFHPEALLKQEKLPDDLTKLVKEYEPLRQLHERKGYLTSIHDDTVAELAYLRGMARGRDWKIAIRQLPSRQEWRSFLGRENLPLFLRGMDVTREYLGKAVDFISMARQKTWARFVGTKEFFESEQAATKVNRWYGSFFRTHGAGGVISLTPYSIAGDLVDVEPQAIDQLRNLAKTFGMKDSRIDQLLGELIDAKGYNARYNWYKRYWETIADESPFLGTVQRNQIRDIWPETLGDRGPGYITTKQDGKIPKVSDTHYGIRYDKRGNPYPSGRPAFSADMLHHITLPNIDTVLELVAFNRRLLGAMRKAGGIRKLGASGVDILQSAFEFSNRLWKSAILMARMPLGLPLRIISEEHLRMAAFDQASLLNHPLEWMKMFRSSDEFAQFADVEFANLGLLHEQFLTDYRKARIGRRHVHIEDGDDFFRAFSVLFSKRVKSPEVRRWYLDNEPEEILRIMESEEGLMHGSQDLLNLWDEAIDPSEPLAMQDRLEAVRRVKQEVEQLIGTGNGAERVRAAMRTGRLDIGSEVAEAGSRQFADELKRMYDEGEWTPEAIEIPSTELEYVWEGRSQLLRQFRDWTFEKFYTNPDAKWSRAPLYRGIALREYKRLLSLGWNKKRALDSAKAHAYRTTADMLYHIGETSSAHHFLRNISPFFPAWQELTHTWLYRVPKQLGGGFLLPGYARLLRKADVWFDFLKTSGLVERRPVIGEDGEVKTQYYVAIPGVGEALSTVMGAGNIVSPASLESFTGILPNPQEGLPGLIPSVGAPTGFALGEIANRFDGTVDDMADALLPFGREVNLGPTAIDRLFLAAGIVPFWNSGTHDYNRLMRDFATMDGVRISMQKNSKSMPKREDFKTQDQYVAAKRAWSEKVLTEAEKWSTVTYLIRGIMSATMPFSFTFDDKAEIEMQRHWAMISTLGEEGEQLISPVIEAFKRTYPDAVWYTTGKTLNLSPDREFSEREELMEEIHEGMVETMTPAEYLRWAVGMNSFSVYMRQRATYMGKLGNTAGEVLLNGFEKQEKLLPLLRDWEAYLDLTEVEAPAGERSFKDLYEEWEKARDEVLSKEERFSLSRDEEIALEAKQALGSLGDLFTSAGVRDADYRKVMGILSEKISGGDFPAPKTTIGKGIEWWYNNVADPYYNEVGRIYDKLNTLEAARRGPYYEELRQLANAQKPRRFQGELMPTPEQVAFNNMSAEEQYVRRLEWATLPVEWLTNFQRKSVNFAGNTKKMEELASYINQQELQFDQTAAQRGYHQSSNDYEELRAVYDQRFRDKAKELGVSKQYGLMTQPKWWRLHTLMRKDFSNGSWNQIIDWTTQIHNKLNAAEISPRGETDAARTQQLWLVQRIEDFRRSDKEFRGIIENLEKALAPSGKDILPGRDLYWNLFFEGYGSAPNYWFTDRS